MKRVISRTIASAALAVSISVASAGVSVNAADARGLDLPTISIAMDGASITVGGTLQSGAVQVEATTTQEAFGAPMLFRLNDGVTPEDLFAALASPELQDANNAALFGSIVFDAQVAAGTSDVQTTLESGEYVAFDTRKNDPTNWPHTTFSVAEAAQPASLPAADATIHAIEFGFRAPNTLHDGDLVRFRNDGFLVHMVIGLRTRNAADARQVAALLLAGKDAKTRHLTVGFEAFMFPVSTGAVQQQALDVKPGRYVLACFMTTQDGREHTQLGMVDIVKVVAAT
jgi:hypothetical protein